MWQVLSFHNSIFSTHTMMAKAKTYPGQAHHFCKAINFCILLENDVYSLVL